MNEQVQRIVVFAIVGILAGFLAGSMFDGTGTLGYLVAGLVGAFAGGYIFSVLVNLDIKNELVSQIATSALGAIVVVFLARLVL